MTDLRAAIAVTLVPYSESSVPPTHGDVLDHGRAGKWIVTSVAAAERAAGQPVAWLCADDERELANGSCVVYAVKQESALGRTIVQRPLYAAPPAQAEPQPEEGDGK